MRTTTKQTKKQKLINASIRRLNAAYKKASSAGRRVLIAKDALKQIQVRKYKVKHGAFVEYDDLIETIPGKHTDAKVQLQPYLHDPDAPTCNVCGIGSLFLSAVRCRNDFQVTPESSFPPNQSTLDWLTEFNDGQRKLIEMAFEMGRGYYYYSHCKESISPGGDSSKEFKATELQKHAVNWARNFHEKNYERGTKQDKARLVALLKNIIRNGGRFNPRER